MTDEFHTMRFADGTPVKFKKGQHCTGVDCGGNKFEGKVISKGYASIVLLTPNHWTPTALIKTVDDEEIFPIEPIGKTSLTSSSRTNKGGRRK